MIINSDLTSLDLKMREKVAKGIIYLVEKYKYLVISKSIENVCINRFKTLPYFMISNKK